MRIEGKILAGAGPIKTIEDVLQIANSKAGGSIVGSMTMIKRHGNPDKTYYVNPSGGYSLNSRGMPNEGHDYYKIHLKEMVKISHDRGKVLVASIAGFTPYECARLSEMVVESGADGQEINFGCPNVWGPGGKQKRIISFDLDVMGEILRLQEQAIGTDFWTAVKPSPYSDPQMLKDVAHLFGASSVVDSVTLCNTFPNAFSAVEGEAAISFGSGLAGLAGEVMRPIVAGQIRQFKMYLPGHIGITAVGGISQRNHIDEYKLLGATNWQVVTAYINEGPTVFDRLTSK